MSLQRKVKSKHDFLKTGIFTQKTIKKMFFLPKKKVLHLLAAAEFALCLGLFTIFTDWAITKHGVVAGLSPCWI